MAILFGTSGGFNFQKSSTSSVQTVYNPVYAPTTFEFTNDLYNIWMLLPSFYRNLMENQEVTQDIWRGVSYILSDHLLDLYQDFYNLSADEIVVHRQKKWQILNFIKTLKFGETFSKIGGVTETFLNQQYYDIKLTGGRELSLWGDVHSAALSEDASVQWEVTLKYDNPLLGLAFGYIEGTKGIRKNGLAIGILGSNIFAAHYDATGTLTHIKASSDTITQTGGRYKLTGTYTGGSKQLTATVHYMDSEIYTETSGVTLGSPGGFTETIQGNVNSFTNVSVGDRVRYSILGTDHDFEIIGVGSTHITIRQKVFPTGQSNIAYKILGQSTAPIQSLVLDVIGQASDYKFAPTSFGSFTIEGLSADVSSEPKDVTFRIYSWKYFYPALLQDAVFIPKIQDKLFSPTVTLEQYKDYQVQGKVVKFSSPQFIDLYAPYIAYDDSTMYKNFGFILGLEEEASTIQYRDKVRGIFRAYYSGPTVSSIRSAVNLFLGLPVAIEPGTVSVVNTTYTGKTGRISILESDGDLRHYEYPSTSTPLVSVSDTVSPFQPLCTGVTIRDYISHPNWIADSIPDITKFHTIQVEIDLTQSSIDTLSSAIAFINNVKPTHKKVIINALQPLSEDLDLQDNDSIHRIQNYSFIDNICNKMNPYFDAQLYTSISTSEFDFAFDQGFIDWKPDTITTESADGIAQALLYHSLIYTKAITGNSQFLSGFVSVTDTTAMTGTGTSLQSQIGSNTHLILFERKSGSGASTTANSEFITLGNNHGVVFGDYIRIGTVDYQVTLAPSNSDTVEVFPYPAATASNLAWEGFSPKGTTVGVASITNETNLTMTTTTNGTNYESKHFIALVANPNYLKTYVDQYEELCPEEGLKIIMEDKSSGSLDAASSHATFGIYNNSSAAYATYNPSGALSLGSAGTQTTTIAEPALA